MKKLILTSSMMVLLCAGYFQSQASEKQLAMEVSMHSDCENEAQVAYNEAFQREYAKSQNLIAADFEGALAYDSRYNFCRALAGEDW